MSWGDIRKGGEHHAWAKSIWRAAQRVARMSKWAVKVVEVRPFDVYQGPYADMTIGRFWSCSDNESTFFYEDDLRTWTAEGTVEQIAAAIREHFRK